MADQRDQYEAPTITLLGSVSDLTQGESVGNFLDDTFPVNTPFNQLTFSA